jgi:hypothetical protein
MHNMSLAGFYWCPSYTDSLLAITTSLFRIARSKMNKVDINMSSEANLIYLSSMEHSERGPSKYRLLFGVSSFLQ